MPCDLSWPGTMDDDESLLDKVDQVVDDVLAEGMDPPEPEDRWERRQRLLDSWTAIILAIAAIGTAWVAFQASQWSGAQSDAQSASAIARSDAGRAATEATSDEIVDSQTWLDWVNAVSTGDKRRAGFLKERFSPTLAKAQLQWLGSAALDSQGNPNSIPKGTPFDLPTYIVPAQAKSDAFAAAAEAKLAEADVASSNATKFVLLAVLFALVLFFASVATKFPAPKTQVALILASLLLLLLGVVRMLLLPQSF